MSRPHPHPYPHPDSMDNSAAKDMDDFDALLRAHEQPVDTTQVRGSNTGQYPNELPQVNSRLVIYKIMRMK